MGEVCGFGRVEVEMMMLPATNHRLVYAMHNELTRSELSRARAVFLRNEDVSVDESAGAFVDRLKRSPALLRALTQSARCVPGSKKYHGARYAACKSWAAWMMYFEAVRRWPALFVTTTIPIHTHWPFIRLCLAADGKVAEYL